MSGPAAPLRPPEHPAAPAPDLPFIDNRPRHCKKSWGKANPRAIWGSVALATRKTGAVSGGIGPLWCAGRPAANSAARHRRRVLQTQFEHATTKNSDSALEVESV